MADSHCINCLYFIDHHMMGQCRRYPLFQNRHKTEWCGEHKPFATVVAALPEDVEPAVEEVKRRGRPPKQLVSLTVMGDVT